MTPEQFSQTDHLRDDLADEPRGGHGNACLASSEVRPSRLFLPQSLRLLTPEDYGLIAMVTVVINFTYSFRTLGLSAATMQKPQLMLAQVTNLFWINTDSALL